MDYVKFHQYMRPRGCNPTQQQLISISNSSSVGNMMINRFEMVPVIENMSAVSTGRQEMSKRQNVLMNRKGYDVSGSIEKQPRRNSYNKLSNYGTHSLRSLPKQISDRDVYEKQNRRYNIISVKPIEHSQTIKKYPKLHLEHIEKNFYQKLQLPEHRFQGKAQRNLNSGSMNRVRNPEQEKLAELNRIQTQHQEIVRTNSSEPHLLLKNLDVFQPNPQPMFRGKMLNNIDEMQGIL